MWTPFERAPAAAALAAVVLAAPCAYGAGPQDSGWYYGITGFYAIQNDSDGTSFFPGSSGTPGTPGGNPCVLGDLLGLGSLADDAGGTSDGCVAGLIGPDQPGTDPLDPTAAQTLRTQIAFKDGYAAALALGYRLDSGLRPELSLGYARNDWDTITLTADNGTRATNRSSNRLAALRLMGSLWYDIDAGAVLPYLGGGIGVQQTRISGDLSESDTGFGYQLGAGIGLPLSERMVVSLDYRFVGADDPEYRTDDGSRLATEYSAHHVGLGLRYTFAPAARPAPKARPVALAEPPPAPPRPVIRCPDTPVGVPVGPDNCPLDSDGDGIPDYLDDCPNSPRGAKVLPNGCAPEGDCRRPRPGEQVDANGCAASRSFILRGVKFEFDSDRLTPEARTILNEVAATLNAYPNIRVELEGHTDHIGTDAYNLGLSERRANAVKVYLSENGVDGRRMKPVGYGESRPIDDNETESGRENNRRVELTVVD